MIFFRKRPTIETILFLIYMSYHSNSGLEEMKEELRGFANSEDEQLETRLHDWIDKHTKGGGDNP